MGITLDGCGYGLVSAAVSPAVNQLGVGDLITHLSTGGGASLEYVQGLTLPGVAALDR